MEIKDSTHDILKKIVIATDDLNGFKVVYIYYNLMKVGKMDFRVDNTKFQRNIKILTHYKMNDEFMNLFEGERNPIALISAHVSKMF